MVDIVSHRTHTSHSMLPARSFAKIPSLSHVCSPSACLLCSCLQTIEPTRDHVDSKKRRPCGTGWRRGFIAFSATRAVSARGALWVICAPKALSRPSTAYGRPCSRARKPVLAAASGFRPLLSTDGRSASKSAKKLVAVVPGHRATIRTPVFRYSAQRARLNERTKALVAP